MIHAIYIGLIILICIGFSKIKKIDRRSFITGSTVFGYRTNNSDTDIVLYLSEKDIDKIIENHSANIIYNSYDAVRLKCGNIDFILISNINEYEKWLKKTSYFIKESKTKQLNRAEVVEGFAAGRIGYDLRNFIPPLEK